MGTTFILLGLACVAIFGAWMTAHDRQKLSAAHRRRRDDPQL